MTNLDKLIYLAKIKRLDSEVSLARSKVAREAGDSWKAEMMEMDAKTSAEEASDCDYKLLLIYNHIEQIADFEQIERVEFDALTMRVPTERIIIGRQWRSLTLPLTFQQQEN